ncbi:carbohydrate sulfotransferase 11-like [Xenia sp. Carnegie-2017]|uniref:carbohydrate sulfotransferase 11-like n=1 Tax=Xenia sp. Carnegie-2017 TaxID=2897299 RepID=UPI001F033067|nr:carbohydrate sulfotransferase 11-like [Xenia sp. Carnegie-2017]
MRKVIFFWRKTLRWAVFLPVVLFVVIKINFMIKQPSEDDELSVRKEREKRWGIEKRQLYRRERVKNECQSHKAKRLPITLKKRALRNLIVNDKHRFIFCDIPKVASSNWKRVFITLNGHSHSPWNIKSSDAHNRTKRLLRYLHEYSASEIAVRLKTYYKFIFVRDPYERLAATYRNKFVESYNLTWFKRVYGRRMINKFRHKRSKNTDISFTEFARYILYGRLNNGHWATYNELCHPCAIEYNFIGYLDKIAQDSRDVIRILGIHNQVQFPLNISSGYKVSSMTLRHKYFTQLPKKYKRRLYRKYKRDFKQFGFVKPTLV